MIEELKKEHSVITDTFKEISKSGFHSKEGMEALLSVQKYIVGHMEKEDKKFYSVLKDAVKSKRMLNETLNVFDENIGAVSNTVNHFFANYATKVRNQLAKEIEWFIETITWRIQREEALLFTMYDKLR